MYPPCPADVFIMFKTPLFKQAVDIFFINKIQPETFIVESKDVNESQSKEKWISYSPILKLCFSEKFRSAALNSDGEALGIINGMEALFEPLAKYQKEFNELKVSGRPAANIEHLYRSSKGYDFRFLVTDVAGANDCVNAILKSFTTIEIYENKLDLSFCESVDLTFCGDEKHKYFVFCAGDWKVVDPLIEVTREIDTNYRQDKDPRIHKPHIIVNKENFNQRLVLDNNWGLTVDGLETLMIKPNDVALYSNISDLNMQQAKAFFEKTIEPRFKIYHGVFPTPRQQKEYYDYFQLVISSVIFAYTALEAFANICIPFNYKYKVEKDGITTIFSKEAIERRFTLREKFKTLLREIIKTPDPTTEQWWPLFIELEDIRNEIIHTKQSKSEERFSKLLSVRIFKVIGVHKEIVRYYGANMRKTNPRMLYDFPYNFGVDEYYAGLTTTEGYLKSLKVLRNS